MTVFEFVAMLPSAVRDLFFRVAGETLSMNKAVDGALAALAVSDPGLAKRLANKVREARQAYKEAKTKAE